MNDEHEQLTLTLKERLQLVADVLGIRLLLVAAAIDITLVALIIYVLVR
jgi:hypothetical protein